MKSEYSLEHSHASLLARLYLRFAGEEDMQGYDISRLQIPMGDSDSMIKGTPPEEPILIRRDMMPNSGSKYSHTSFGRLLSHNTLRPHLSGHSHSTVRPRLNGHSHTVQLDF